jgi:hypothetical protein
VLTSFVTEPFSSLYGKALDLLFILGSLSSYGNLKVCISIECERNEVFRLLAAVNIRMGRGEEAADSKAGKYPAVRRNSLHACMRRDAF